MGTSLSWLRSFNFCLSYFWEFGIFLVLLGTLDTLESFFLFQCTSCLHNWIKCHQIFSLSNCCLFCFSFFFLFLPFSMVPYFKSFFTLINCFASKMLDFLSNLLIKSKFILVRLNTLSL